MAGLIYESELNVSIENLIKEAEEHIFLFCNSFQLPHRIKDCLLLRKDHHALRIVIVFGGIEAELSSFLKTDDFAFLQQFPNISISYEPRLNANYFANEIDGIITSMNMQTYGDNRFIDIGVCFKTKNMLKNLTNQTLGGITSLISDTENIATEAADFFDKVLRHAERIFETEPQYESKMFGLSKKYKNSIPTVNNTAKYLVKEAEIVTVKTAPPNKPAFTEPQVREKPTTGFCIRTGVSITYDLRKPLSWEAYRSWVQFGNPNYTEKYCHGCGAKFATSVNDPLCNVCKQ